MATKVRKALFASAVGAALMAAPPQAVAQDIPACPPALQDVTVVSYLNDGQVAVVSVIDSRVFIFDASFNPPGVASASGRGNNAVIVTPEVPLPISFTIELIIQDRVFRGRCSLLVDERITLSQTRIALNPCTGRGEIGALRPPDDAPTCPRQSPIVVDLGREGLDLTGLDDPVLFDIDADGGLELTGWTSVASRDAFLAFDRNSNGTIDDGMELFGDAVDLASGMMAAQGYEALAEVDLPALGGNANGYADVSDKLYRALLLWTDTNHNGLSERQELRPLMSEGIFAIRLTPQMGMQIDENGNLLAFSSPAFAIRRGRIVELRTTDVFFGIRDLLAPGLPDAPRR